MFFSRTATSPPPTAPHDGGEGGTLAFFGETPGGRVVFAFGGPGSGTASTAEKAAEASGMEFVVLDPNQPTREALQQLDELVKAVPSHRGVMVHGLLVGHDFYEQFEHHTGIGPGAGTMTSTSFLDHFPRVFQLHPTPPALWAVFYLVPSLTSC